MYYLIINGHLSPSARPPASTRPFAEQIPLLLPPQVGFLHEAFRAWGQAGFSPGTLAPPRIWWSPSADDAVDLAFRLEANRPPRALSQSDTARDLAAWLVLLDRYVETFVVIARARAVWSPVELSGALSFTTPAFLPAALGHSASGNDGWAQVAAALAAAVADGPLKGQPQNRHWSLS